LHAGFRPLAFGHVATGAMGAFCVWARLAIFIDIGFANAPCKPTPATSVVQYSNGMLRIPRHRLLLVTVKDFHAFAFRSTPVDIM